MSQRLLRHLAGALALLLTLAGCDPRLLPGGGLPNTGVPQDGISQTIPLIEGELVDAAGQPVEGATVRAYVAPYRIEALSPDPVSASETTTDAHGAFKLVAPSLGSVAVEARGKGQKALRTGVSVKSGTQVELGTLS
ncbi:MAG TPA: carboxypeptidase-like regulatory domain-containing protein, partial [Stenomitos sp.]